MADLRNDAAAERHAHRARVGTGLLGHALDFVERHPFSGRCAGSLVDEDDAGHTAALVFLPDRRRGDVVVADHRQHPDVLDVGHFRGHVEIEDVAGVVAVDVEHASALVDGLGDFEHLVRARRLKHPTDGATVEQSLAHVAEKKRQVTRAATGRDPDLAFDEILRHHAPLVVGNEAHLARVGGVDAFEHFVDEILGLVEEFLHGRLL